MTANDMAKPSSKALPEILFIWDQFGPYHMDRLEALGAALGSRAHVVGIEVSATSGTYAWAKTGAGQQFEKRTLFGTTPVEMLRTTDVARALAKEVSRPTVGAVFVSGYERPSHFLAAMIARRRGARTIVMLDSKYDDKPRRTWLETVKRALMAPYHGGFAAGRRSTEYLRFLGLRRRPITQGYDTVSLSRIRSEQPVVAPLAWEDRPFLAIARYVPKKNLQFLLHAYAEYRSAVGSECARPLILCGGGPLEASLRATASTLQVDEAVTFSGFVGQGIVADLMRNALCLLLPSVEEQWGLVVNEALAFDLPVLLSKNVGAADLLVTDGGNGYLLDPHDRSGWSDAMQRLGKDSALWRQMATCSHALAPLGDVARFVEGVVPHLPSHVVR
jgi:glycosyltransferase involved in cell wall biosynthesis